MQIRIGIRYCGGCNSRYDRRAEIAKLQKEFPEAEFVYDSGTVCYLWLLVCGCASACVSAEGLKRQNVIRISQRRDFLQTKKTIRELLEHIKSEQTDNGSLEKPVRQMTAGTVETGETRRIQPGDTSCLEHSFSLEDVRSYARLSLDENPLHMDPEFSRKSIFRRPVVHGVLVAGLLSSVMGMRLPGPGTVLMEEQVQFLHPVYPEEQIRAEIIFTGYEEKKRYYIGEFTGRCTNPDGVVVISGKFRQMMLKKYFTIEDKENGHDKS